MKNWFILKGFINMLIKSAEQQQATVDMLQGVLEFMEVLEQSDKLDAARPA